MPIVRGPYDRDFTRIPNCTLRDARLTPEAKIVLLHLLSKPDDWTVGGYRTVAAQTGLSDRAARAAYRTLETAGYMTRQAVATSGSLTVWVHTVYDRADAIKVIAPSPRRDQGDRADAIKVIASSRPGETSVETAPGAITSDASVAIALLTTELLTTKSKSKARGLKAATAERKTRVKAKADSPAESEAEVSGTRSRNLVWDAWAEAVGWEPSNRQAATRIGKAVRVSRESVLAAHPEATDEQIARAVRFRAGRYRQEWPDAELTPEALTKHWDRFGPPPHRPPPDPETVRPVSAWEACPFSKKPHAMNAEEFAWWDLVDRAQREWREAVKTGDEEARLDCEDFLRTEYGITQYG